MPGKKANKNKKWKAQQSNRLNPYDNQTEKTDTTCDVFSLAIEKYGRLNDNGLLDCANLNSIDEIKKYNPNMNNQMWCTIVTKTVKKSKGCKALTLDGNGIRNLYYLASALGDGVELDSLSLQNNKIDSTNDLVHLRPLKLQHLMLQGNPLYTKTNEEELFQAIKKHLPTLLRIDGCFIDRSTAIDTAVPIKAPSDLAVDAAAGGLDQAVVGFMEKYYVASETCSGPDGTVDSLLGMYDMKATMSLSIQPGLSFSLTGKGLQFAAKLKANNRLVNVGTLNVGKCLEVLHEAKITYDSQAILKHTEALLMAPETVAGAGYSSVFASPSGDPTLVTVTTHGSMTYSFEEKGGKKMDFKKYFDRTWILTAKGGGPVIVNDMIHIRDTKQEKEPVFRPQQNDAYYGLHMKQEDDRVIALSSRTNVRPAIARSCLEMPEVEWDVDKAASHVEAYMTSGRLTPEHFQQQDEAALRVEMFSERIQRPQELAAKILPEVNYDLWRGWEFFKSTGL
eukprot:TRINITY_DN648_c0_g1_i1.p1 TRINITY_DN648_c0_g1~~TRINITY_DN648_c0_g1_i1.p1  ORF type:complete len:507 (+),score=206.77 TRINITY_DN648_c0_g1_i1:59-1579(+)